MGVGFVVILSKQDAEKAIETIEQYYPAFIIGEVVEDGKEEVKLKTLNDTWIKL
jgi:phosphoribosylaminoimidazole (AIR) synthetase